MDPLSSNVLKTIQDVYNIISRNSQIVSRFKNTWNTHVKSKFEQIPRLLEIPFLLIEFSVMIGIILLAIVATARGIINNWTGTITYILGSFKELIKTELFGYDDDNKYVECMPGDTRLRCIAKKGFEDILHSSTKILRLVPNALDGIGTMLFGKQILSPTAGFVGGIWVLVMSLINLMGTIVRTTIKIVIQTVWSSLTHSIEYNKTMTYELLGGISAPILNFIDRTIWNDVNVCDIMAVVIMMLYVFPKQRWVEGYAVIVKIFTSLKEVPPPSDE